MILMTNELKEILITGLSDLNIEINDHQYELFSIFLSELIKWNSKYNLTAITDEKSIIIKHFLDSAVIANEIRESEKQVMDLGSGAGFPGIVLKILKPDIFLTSVDSNDKKIYFQKNLARLLNLNSTNFVAKRAEESSFIRYYSNFFEYAIVRALKRLPDILTIMYPLVKKGAHVFILKGRNYKYELTELNNKDVSQRFTLKKVEPYTLPYIKREHFILVYEKI